MKGINEEVLDVGTDAFCEGVHGEKHWSNQEAQDEDGASQVQVDIP